MAVLKQILLLFIIACSFASCSEKQKNIVVSMDSFASLRNPEYFVDSVSVREQLRREVLADTDRVPMDASFRRYYLNGGSLLWLTRSGVSAKADSVLAYVNTVESMGFNKEHFCFSRIEKDLKSLRSLDFSRCNVNKMMARLEYNLSKAFFRYCVGQRFGFMNPRDVFNRIDVRDSDSVRVTYRSLYDVKLKTADKKFYARAFDVVRNGRGVAEFLRESRPSNPVYELLVRRLAAVRTREERKKLLCNIERSRWCQYDYPGQYEKYVVVNIPSLHLVAVDNSETITMRIGLGALETKTPLLTSRIKRMDFNPQWVIPKSIVKKSIVCHAGSKAYFDSHNYFIRDRKTGSSVDPSQVSGEMLMSRDYMVVQRGGIGNALGRVIFRFDNNFSIFMHDTSNPGVFSRSDRSVSHGCIRVEKPFDLAVFMLKDKDERVIDKLRYSMTVNYDTRVGAEEKEAQQIDKSMMVRSLPVSPEIPLFITYYTMYPDRNGNVVAYPDIYGYDAVVYDKISKFL